MWDISSVQKLPYNTWTSVIHFFLVSFFFFIMFDSLHIMPFVQLKTHFFLFLKTFHNNDLTFFHKSLKNDAKFSWNCFIWGIWRREVEGGSILFNCSYFFLSIIFFIINLNEGVRTSNLFSNLQKYVSNIPKTLFFLDFVQRGASNNVSLILISFSSLFRSF